MIDKFLAVKFVLPWRRYGILGDSYSRRFTPARCEVRGVRVLLP